MVPGLFRDDEILVFVLSKRASYDQQPGRSLPMECSADSLLPCIAYTIKCSDNVTGQFSFSGGGVWRGRKG